MTCRTDNQLIGHPQGIDIGQIQLLLARPGLVVRATDGDSHPLQRGQDGIAGQRRSGHPPTLK